MRKCIISREKKRQKQLRRKRKTYCRAHLHTRLEISGKLVVLCFVTCPLTAEKSRSTAASFGLRPRHARRKGTRIGKRVAFSVHQSVYSTLENTTVVGVGGVTFETSSIPEARRALSRRGRFSRAARTRWRSSRRYGRKQFPSRAEASERLEEKHGEQHGICYQEIPSSNKAVASPDGT
jgi:hypothetical protein